MTTLFKYVQVQDFSLAGSGAIAGATSITLKSFKTIDGSLLAMTDFGSIGFGTLEPGNGTSEEQISWTGVVQNANGTATLTGVSSVLFVNPYTASSGLAKTHAGSTSFIVSNTAGFYNQFPAKANDEHITGQWTFDILPITPVTPNPATTLVLGIVKLSVAPVSALSPIAVETTDPRVPVAYAVDSVGTDAYAITPSPAITAYAAGQMFTFKAGTANTGAATLNVNGLGAKTIKKYVSTDLVTGDILLNQIITVIYDGTNMQLISIPSSIPTTTIYKNGTTTKNTADASTTQNIPHGLGVIPKKVKLTAFGGITGNNGGIASSIGSYDGTTQSCVWFSGGTTSVNFNSGNSTSYTLGLTQGQSSGDPGTLGQTGVVTFDATNIIITWTKISTPTSVFSILWEAEG